ncbi:MAG TPA: hypothetical protein VGX28_14035 [Frankiaceae bacterium]|jgi:hypothetical protein|nr:hypothetical protein [Frankiaceae bacterium]
MRPSRVLATALLPLALVACGQSAKKAAPQVVQRPADVLRLAAEKTVAARTARMEMHISGGGLEMTGSGVTSLTEMKAVMTTKTSIGDRTVDSEVRVLGDVMWMTTPPGVAVQKPWLKIDVAALGKRLDVDIKALREMQQQNDPSQSLAYLQGASDDFAETGTADLRGTPTTIYKGTLNLAKARDGQRSERTRKAIESLITKLKSETLPITVWIDGDGRMRKMIQTIDLAKVTDGQASGTMTTTIEMYDFGAPVVVTPPPAAQVGDGGVLFRR